MAYTYSKIASVTVGSGGVSSIAFLAIPQNYTDLVLMLSLRSARVGGGDDILVTFNSSSTGFTYREIQGTGSAVGSYNGSLNYFGSANAANNTANTFSNISVYIPNYAGSNNKSISIDSVFENNATTAQQDLAATLWSNTAAINSIILTTGTNNNFVQYSTATLYGIKAEV